MFRKMIRKDRQLSDEQAKHILKNGRWGVFALSGDENYPYAVPMHYVYANERLFIHGATSGHKVDAMTRNEKVSFCVVDYERFDENEFTAYFASVIVFGHARFLTGEPKRKSLDSLIQKYGSNAIAKGNDEIKDKWDICLVVEIDVEHISAKGC